MPGKNGYILPHWKTRRQARVRVQSEISFTEANAGVIWLYSSALGNKRTGTGARAV